MKKWLLIDGYNLVFRSFYGMPPLTRSDGFPVGAVYGWIRTLWRIEDEERPDAGVVFFDKGGDPRREAILPSYKANRVETPEILELQTPYLKELTLVMGYARVEKEGVEADDLISTAALALREREEEAIIVSADKDLSQCVGPGVHQLVPPLAATAGHRWVKLDAEGVKRKHGVMPDQIHDFLALVGDSSDNIRGLRGVGPQIAANWLNSFSDLENLIANADRIYPSRYQTIVRENVGKLRRNRSLTKLKTDFILGPLDPPPTDPDRLLEILKELRLESLYREAQARYAVELSGS